MNGPMTYNFSWKSIVCIFRNHVWNLERNVSERSERVSDKNRKLKIIFFFPRRYLANSKYKQKNVLRDKILIVIFEIVIKISIIKINFTNEFVYIWKNIWRSLSMIDRFFIIWNKLNAYMRNVYQPIIFTSRCFDWKIKIAYNLRNKFYSTFLCITNFLYRLSV